MKIVLIGAGSYVFGPSVFSQLYLDRRLADVHLALVDPDLETIGLLAGAGRRLAWEQGISTIITTHGDRGEALSDADFVICSASPQMQRRFAMDCEIIDRIAPEDQKTEFGGITGISYSLRQIALIEAVTDDMRRLCPAAWLLDVANPLPRVTQAAHENGIKTAGFCVASLTAYTIAWDLFYSSWLDFPFTEAQEKWDITSAGLNHFAWITEFRDRSTGADLLPALRTHLMDGNVSGANPRSQQLLRELGYLLVPGDEHTRDFLAPLPAIRQAAETPWHGNPLQRQQRHDLLRQIAEGAEPWNALRRNEAWEKPVELIDALTGGPAAFFHAMNLINDRRITNLPPGVFVETPCEAADGRIVPKEIALPESVLPLSERTAHVTDTIVRAARERSRARVHTAVRLDPTIMDKAAGIQAIDACMIAHADLLPIYS